MIDRKEVVEAQPVAMVGQVVWPLASPEEADKGWTLDYRFIEQVERIASQRTDYTTSMEATEQVLIAANEVLRVSQPAAQQPSADQYIATFRCETNGIVGTTDAKVHSVTRLDDGRTEVVIDHWPEQPAAVDGWVLEIKPDRDGEIGVWAVNDDYSIWVSALSAQPGGSDNDR